MKNFGLKLIVFIIAIVSLFALDIYLANEVFCASCEFDDKNWLFGLFYNNDADSGYHSEPTVFNVVFVFGFGFLLSWIFGRLLKR